MLPHATPSGESVPPRPVLFSDRGCPYAHRVLGLLDHLGVPLDLVATPPGQLPDGLARWSPSGRVPLLVHGAVTIGESRVMLEHLAEAYGFEGAYPRALTPRTLHRHAMAWVDGLIAPTLADEDRVPSAARLAECLDAFEALAFGPPEPCLLTFHFAPIWLRLQWWRPEGVVTRAIRQRPRLTEWLDGAASLEAISRTAPDEGENVADFHAVCALQSAARRPAAPGGATRE